MINETYQSITKDLPKLDISTLPLPTNPVPDKYIINIENVEKKIAQINIFKAFGPDSIPNWILHGLCSIISHPICAIFNSSLQEGFFSVLWKSASVINLPKVNPPQGIKCDLHPISLTPVLLLDYSKAFDLVDHNILVKCCTAMMFLIFLYIGLAICCLIEGSMCELIKTYLTGFM